MKCGTWKSCRKIMKKTHDILMNRNSISVTKFHPELSMQVQVKCIVIVLTIGMPKKQSIRIKMPPLFHYKVVLELKMNVNNFNNTSLSSNMTRERKPSAKTKMTNKLNQIICCNQEGRLK